jgi:SWI/SNF-related matrix-associated actin-dependent regulator of chromatin subfamily A member 5
MKCARLTLLCGVGVTRVYSQQLNAITVPLREPQVPEDAAKKLEAKRQAAQHFIDNRTQSKFSNGSLSQADGFLYQAEPFTEGEQAHKEAYLEEGFPDWSRPDFRQLAPTLEAYAW